MMREIWLRMQEINGKKNLFNFLETSFQYLDNHLEIANFHLVFLLKLTKYCGSIEND